MEALLRQFLREFVEHLRPCLRDDLREVVRAEVTRASPEPFSSDEAGQLLTVKEVARACRVSKGTVRAWIGSGRLHGTKVSRSYRVRREDLAKLLSEGTAEAAAGEDHLHAEAGRILAGPQRRSRT